MNDDGGIRKTISWHEINCILIFICSPYVYPWEMRVLWANNWCRCYCCCSFLIKHSKSLVNPSFRSSWCSQQWKLICISVFFIEKSSGRQYHWNFCNSWDVKSTHGLFRNYCIDYHANSHWEKRDLLIQLECHSTFSSFEIAFWLSSLSSRA